MRIGVFGGSFDPIHLGHLIVAQAAAEILDLDEVRFVLARQQPFKDGAHAASVEDRREMLVLALRGNPRFVVDTSELDREGKSYTVDTLRSLRDQFPQDQLFLMVGADAAGTLSTWSRAEQLPDLAQIVALSRVDDPPPESELIGRRIKVPSIDISATEIRNRRAAGRSIRYHVPPDVFDYIETRGLYVSEAECSNKSSPRLSAPGSTAN